MAGARLGRDAGVKSIMEVGAESSLVRSASVSMLAKERALVERNDWSPSELASMVRASSSHFFHASGTGENSEGTNSSKQERTS